MHVCEAALPDSGICTFNGFVNLFFSDITYSTFNILTSHLKFANQPVQPALFFADGLVSLTSAERFLLYQQSIQGAHGS